jgi:hypothetical protein
MIRIARIIRPAIPPTTPPTIAPMLLLLLLTLAAAEAVTTDPAGRVVVKATVVVYIEPSEEVATAVDCPTLVEATDNVVVTDNGVVLVGETFPFPFPLVVAVLAATLFVVTSGVVVV